MKDSVFIILILTAAFVMIASSNREDSKKFTKSKDSIHFHIKKSDGVNPKIQEIICKLENDMIDYMSFGQVSYKRKDVKKCIRILNKYLKNIEKTSNKEEGMQVVKSTVLDLNELNAKCDSELIETMERENICEILNLAWNEKGYISLTDDITEKWREW